MLQSHIDVLQQVLDLLPEIGVEDYQRIMTPHLSGSIGQHIRHVVDHYLALETGYQQGLVDYNQRNRKADIECSVATAIETLLAIQGWLASLNAAALDKPVTVQSEVSVTNRLNVSCQSTMAREILFVSSHAIHHFSLISVIRSLQGETVPKHFGIAPATLTERSNPEK